jgi:hypothetical protein
VTTGRYPNDEKGIFIDLTDLDYATDEHSWETAKAKIKNDIDRALSVGNNEHKESHLSVFAMAPIPVLAFLGYTLGNIINADIYIKRREQPWHVSSSIPQLSLKVLKPTSSQKAKLVGLSIAISDQPTLSDIKKHIGSAPLYTIKPKKSGLDHIACREDLEAFRKLYRETLDDILQIHGKQCVIHLFGAMPTCAAVVCGRELLHGSDPVVVMYEHISQEEGYLPVLKLNDEKYGTLKKKL